MIVTAMLVPAIVLGPTLHRTVTSSMAPESPSGEVEQEAVELVGRLSLRARHIRNQAASLEASAVNFRGQACQNHVDGLTLIREEVNQTRELLDRLLEIRGASHVWLHYGIARLAHEAQALEHNTEVAVELVKECSPGWRSRDYKGSVGAIYDWALSMEETAGNTFGPSESLEIPEGSAAIARLSSISAFAHPAYGRYYRG